MFYFYKESSKENFDNIENSLPFVFPKQYRLFLENYNGMFIEYPNFVEFFSNSINNTISLEYIFNINDLLEFNLEYLDEIEESNQYIIIARDSGGNFFLMCKEEKIYYWDREFFYNDNSCIYYLFNSFNELFSIIKKASHEQNSPFTISL